MVPKNVNTKHCSNWSLQNLALEYSTNRHMPPLPSTRGREMCYRCCVCWLLCTSYVMPAVLSRHTCIWHALPVNRTSCEHNYHDSEVLPSSQCLSSIYVCHKFLSVGIFYTQTGTVELRKGLKLIWMYIIMTMQDGKCRCTAPLPFRCSSFLLVQSISNAWR